MQCSQREREREREREIQNVNSNCTDCLQLVMSVFGPDHCNRQILLTLTVDNRAPKRGYQFVNTSRKTAVTHVIHRRLSQNVNRWITMIGCVT